jgi:hypothetical protein
MDIGDVDGDTIERAGLKDKEFERFVKRLLKAERELRHRADAELRGPVADYHGDDKRDLEFIVHGPPKRSRTDFTAALTWDGPGKTWYSCKGGSTWRSAILAELGQRAYNEFQKNGSKPGAGVRKRPPSKLLDHVQAGGRYVFVISVAAIDDRELLDEVVKQLKFWLEIEGRSVPAELKKQFEFIDANRLADFISTYRPELSEDQRRALGLSEPSGLKSWAQWTDELGAGRDLPDFAADDERDALFEAIADPSNDVLRVFGPPGVGKTRVVHEGIRRCGEEAREQTRYSDDFDVSLTAVQDDWLRRGSKPWLVLDELRSVDVEQVTAKFRANASKEARLFLVGTSDAQTRAIPGREFLLSELSEEQTRRLIRGEAGSLPDAQLDAIWQLSEGYPWYAVLLARSIAIDDQILEHGNDETVRWSYGTQRVLAGHPREHGPNWEREAELRAKTLLVAMLTRDVELDWDDLCERHGDGLRLAIAEPTDWHEVVRREPTCRQRQLLRQSGLQATRRYVSPNNLARLILHHFLTDPDLSPKIRRHTPEFRGTLVAVAKAVRVKPAIIEKLARGEWEELERRARHEGLDALEAYVRRGDPCYEAARDAPELAARTMASVITLLPVQQLESAGNLKVVARFVFEHVIHRKISAESFLGVESALLILARIEGSTFSNNARGIWKSLFLPGLHATHQAWELRRGRLDIRLADSDIFVRGLAIDALEWAVESREQGLGYSDDDRADGDWPLPTMAELGERKAQLWERLRRACEDDEPKLAARARSAVARRLRGGLGRGLFADGLAHLTVQVRAWAPAERRELLETIADIRRYDLDDYSELPELLRGLDELERAAAPTDLQERTRAQFGTWHPGPWQIDDPERDAHEREQDLELAHALLGDPGSLEWAIEWSASPEAHRGPALWAALGRADRGGGVHIQLVRIINDGFPANALGQYLLGWAETETVEAVETWLFGGPLENYPGIASAALWFLVFQTPTHARLDRIRALVEHGTMTPQALALLGFRGWAEVLEPNAILDFLAALPDVDELDEVSLRSSLALLERELEDEQRATAVEILGHTFRRCLEHRVPIGAQHLVTKAGRVLVEAGQCELVSVSILEALEVDAGGGSNIHVGHELLTELLRKGHGEALWSTLAGALLERESSSLPWQLANDRLLDHVPESTVLDWVGHDHRRASIAASMTNPHDESLDPIARELLVRFGAEGDVASRLQSRALSTPGVVSGGLVKFERRQRDNAKAWQRDTSLAVRIWAKRIETNLTERVDEHDARVEFRAKYG